MDLENDAGRLLEQLDVLRHPSDLDLLIFFARHPRTLLSSEQLAAFLGYGVKEIAASLDLLLEAGFLTRTPNPRHSARMYVFAVTPPGGGWLPAVKRLASTRGGRLALIWAIRRRLAQTTADPTQRAEPSDTATARPLRFPPVRTALEDSPGRLAVVPNGASREPRKPSKRGGER